MGGTEYSCVSIVFCKLDTQAWVANQNVQKPLFTGLVHTKTFYSPSLFIKLFAWSACESVCIHCETNQNNLQSVYSHALHSLLTANKWMPTGYWQSNLADEEYYSWRAHTWTVSNAWCDCSIAVSDVQWIVSKSAKASSCTGDSHLSLLCLKCGSRTVECRKSECHPTKGLLQVGQLLGWSLFS